MLCEISSGEGKSFGEVALLKEDCIRTATVVSDTDTDLVVIDRALYNRSVRDVLEREYTQKTQFVDTNILFKVGGCSVCYILVFTRTTIATRMDPP